MARKPSETRSIVNQRRERVFNEQAFVRGVFSNEYVLVVGSGTILDRSQFPDSGGDINQYIINEINHDRRKAINGFVDYKDFTDVASGTLPNEEDLIYSFIGKELDYNLADMNPDLTALLRTKLFRFVLTTTIDEYLETLLRDIWKDSGEELRIVNIADNQSLKDFQDALKNCRSNKYEQPTLFYVFGKVIPGRPRPRGFVETDVDAIKIIEKWLMEVDREHIVPFLNSKRMLALGCKFDDWYFRFFWYIITRGFSDSDRGGYKDFDGNLQTGDSLAAMFTPDDCHLREYLTRRGVCLHDDMWQFTAHILQLLTSTDEHSPFREMVLNSRRQGGIFISYKSCDVADASQFFCRLTRDKFTVWFDNVRLSGGDNYDANIHDAIRKAKVFVPILSPAIAAELEEQGTAIHTYYSDEWRWAAEQSDLLIIPVTIGGFRPHSEAYGIFEQIIGHKVTGIDMLQQPAHPNSPELVRYAKLIDSISKHLHLS